jgi:amino acid adenylation domain-containing protein
VIDLASRLEDLSPAKRELLLRQLKKLKGEAPRPVLRPRAERLADFPLSYAQQRLWFLDQLEPGNPFYNLPGAVRLQGPLDEACLGRALSGVVARHESLRTGFPAIQGRPVQRVSPPAPFQLPVVDLTALPEALRRSAGRALAQAAVRRPFDLATGPLLRAVLLRLSADERILAFAVHHIVADGWSLRVLVRELTSLYQAFRQGLPSPLAALPMQYADYALAEREWLDGEALAPQLEFWRRQLAGLTGALELPADWPRPEAQTFRGARQAVVLSAGTVAALRELGQTEKATPFMVLLAAFAVLLHRYSGSEDVPLGTPITNRDRLETEGLIGFFVNTLVMRCDLAGDPGFRQLLARVRETTLGAFAHPDLPFERLVEELRPDRDLGRTPLFQVLFAYQSAAAEGRGASELSLEHLPVETGKSLFDLTLALDETPGRIAGAFEYNTDLFDAVRMRRMAGHLETLLAAVVREPDGRLSELPVLTTSERHQLAVEWTDTFRRHPGDLRLHERFEAQAARTPDEAAVVHGEIWVTYRELEARANRLARALVAAGAGRETRVGICLPRTPDLVASLLAVWKAGAAYVPMDPAYPEERLAYMLEDSGAAVLVAGPGAADGLAARVSVVLRPDELAGDEADDAGSPAVPGSVDDLAYVIYTSGSTGRPKGVAIAHASAAVLLDWAGETFAPADLAAVLASTSICFDLSVFELFVPLVHGGTVILAENALELPRLAAADRVTLLNTVPSALGELLRERPLPSSVRTVCLAGEALRRGLVDRIYETLPGERVYNLYGPSEDTTYSTFTRVPRGDGAPTIGRPVANTRAYVLDARGSLVPCGVPGEIWLAGDGLARGYLGRPELTAERFVPDPFAIAPGARAYRTGDLARWSPAGELEFLGRLDHQVKVRGFRIELGEIEVALERHPAVKRAAVLAGPDGQSLVAWVAAPEAAGLAPAELRAFLRARLPEHMVPALFVTLAALPLTANGKIDRQALGAQRPRPATAGVAGFVAPRNPAEELLAGIWEAVLGVEGVGAHDNFFDLGGHSLLATQMVSRMREAFAVELPLRTLFEAPTVAGLAVRVEEARRAGGPAVPPVVPVPRAGRLLTSFGQQRLWFLDQLEPGSTVYNLPAAVRLQGALDVPVLALALAEVVSRHEALRTVFLPPEAGDDEPAQRILAALAVAVPLMDLAALPPAAREAEARRLAAVEVRRPFDLVGGPLLRAAVVRLAGDDHILVLTLHHIVSDGWSLNVLVREVAALYAAFSQRLPSPLPPLAVQYADYAAWQRGWLRGPVLEGQIDFWRRALAGALPLLDLPADRPRPPMQTFRGGRSTLPVPGALAATVRALGRTEGATSFMVWLAAVHLLLHRLSGQTLVTVGSPIANRARPELEPLIGFFANTLVLAGDHAGDPGFRQLIARVRERALGAYAHQDLPFEKLVEELAPERNLAYSPLFQVMFSFQTLQTLQASVGSAATAGGLSLLPVDADLATAKFDLTFEVEEREGGFACAVEYNRDLFDAATAGRLLAQLRDLLAFAVADPEARASELPLLAASQRSQVLVEWNDTPLATDPGFCLHDLVAAQARESPGARAVVVADGTALTRAELAARSGQVAAFLRGLGLGPEVLVGICMERSLDMVVAMLGVLEAGAAYLPLDPAYPTERLDFMLADSAAPVVLTQERLLGRWGTDSDGGPHRVCLDRDWPEIAAAPPASTPAAATPDHLAYTIYTSGSTGRPKGVAIAHRSATALLRWACEVFPERDRAGVLASTSICFDLSVFELFLPLCHGGTVMLAETALHLPRHAAAGEVTLVNTVPSAIAELVRGDGLPPAVRAVVLAGEPLPRRLVDEIYACGDVERVCNCYGPSEDTTYSTYALIDRAGGPPPIGRPVGGGWAYLLDAGLQPAPLGAVGELYLGGAGLARGYLGRPELTAERFVPDPFSAAPGARLYRTGDLVRYRPDGEMLFLGRADHQVKIRGFRIELGEIEAALRRHPAVAEAVVLARGEAGEQRLVAYVVGGETPPPAAEELRGFLRVMLPAHMIPWAFVALPALPLNANGKLDRKALPDPERAAWGAPVQMEEPQTDMERTVAEVWRQVLHLERVGIDDNFFDSGGHSLLAVRVRHRLKAALGRDLPLVALFEHPTIRSLARSLATGEETEPATRQRGQERGAKRREAAAGRLRPLRAARTDAAPETEEDFEEILFP